MHDHIRDLLSRFQYSDQLQETAVSRVLFEGEDLSQVATDLGIHSTYTLTHLPKTTDSTHRFKKYRPGGPA